MTERVDVIIATYNRSIELSNLLCTLLGQTFKAWDLVVIDESERPSIGYPYVASILKHLELLGHNVTYKRNEQRMGVGYIRNLTVKYATNEYLCRVDDDSLLAPDYLERLYKLIKKEDVAAVGGVVPLAHSPYVWRDLNQVKIFNEMKFDNQGNLVVIGDDGGYMWKNPRIIESHHLRSSFMFKKSVHDMVGGHPDWINDTGFREESILTNKFFWKGYKLLTDTEAVAHHNKLNSGGTTSPDYAIKAQRMDIAYRDWLKREIIKNGNPFTISEENV